MRTPEVDAIIRDVKNLGCSLKSNEAYALAAEVDRLESQLTQTDDIAAQRMESCAKMLARAETAEARVAELDAQITAARKAWLGDDFAHLPLVEAMEQYRIENDNRIEGLEAQNARFRAALGELRRNVIEVILPNAKNITLDLGQVALWDECVKQTEAALADGKAAPS